MEQKAYEYLKQSEDSWWWKGRAYAVSRLLSKYVHSKDNNILDVGAGYGSMYPVLALYGDVLALEVYEEAANVCRMRGYREVLTHDDDLNGKGKAFDLIGAFDVIEHIENDQKFLDSLYKSLKPGGLIIATVPAYQALWSTHDVEHHHFRRYTKSSLKYVFSEAGFKVIYSSYWNFSLFPVAFALRKLGHGGDEGLNPGGVINSLISGLLWLESRCMSYVSFPWGVSVVILARRVK
jgi:SAM-dependent methyltransferase